MILMIPNLTILLQDLTSTNEYVKNPLTESNYACLILSMNRYNNKTTLTNIIKLCGG